MVVDVVQASDANLVVAVFSFFTLIFLTPLFRNMPQPALAAIVIAAMLHLTKPSYLLHLLARSPGRLPTLSL